MKKVFVIFSLFSIALNAWSAAGPLGSEQAVKGRSAEKQLRESIQKELSSAIRVSIDRFFTHESIPLNASLSYLYPHPPMGVVNFEFTWEEKGHSKKAAGTAVVKAYAPVVVSKKLIRHNDPFTDSNIMLQERELTAFRATGFYESLDSLRTMRANGYLSPGSVVDFHHAQEPFLVTQGEMIDLVKETASLRVVAKVKALENGRRNQWIRVENPNSKKNMQVLVVGASEAHLN